MKHYKFQMTRYFTEKKLLEFIVSETVKNKMVLFRIRGIMEISVKYTLRGVIHRETDCNACQLRSQNFPKVRGFLICNRWTVIKSYPSDVECDAFIYLYEGGVGFLS